MNATWQLLWQPARQTPALSVLAALCWGAAALSFGQAAEAQAVVAVALLALGAWVWHVGAGQTLRELCRPESFLLPGFRRRLLQAGLLDGAIWALLPAVALRSAGHADGWLTGALLWLIAALGLAVGSGRRAALLMWVVMVAAGWMPRFTERLVAFALASAWTLPLTALAAAAATALSVRPLLRLGDRDDSRSPLESTGLDRFQAPPGDGWSPRRSGWARWLGSRFDATAQWALARAMHRYRLQPHSAVRRLALIRCLLLPHDNLRAIVLRLMLVAAAASLYFVLLHRRHYFQAEAIGAYATLLALSRFPQLGRGMQRMRPHLADLYLTLAPSTRAEFQQTLADALLILVPVGALTALAYTALGIVLVHAAEPLPMVLAVALTATSASLVGLAAHLIGPESTLGRGLVNIVLMLGAMAVYWGGYRLIDALGYLFGGGIVAVLELSFGIGVWLAAHKEYRRRLPRFD